MGVMNCTICITENILRRDYEVITRGLDQPDSHSCKNLLENLNGHSRYGFRRFFPLNIYNEEKVQGHIILNSKTIVILANDASLELESQRYQILPKYSLAFGAYGANKHCPQNLSGENH